MDAENNRIAIITDEITIKRIEDLTEAEKESILKSDYFSTYVFGYCGIDFILK